MTLISSDKDLPRLLDTPMKEVNWAKGLLLSILAAAKRVDKPPMQGMYNTTVFLTLADGEGSFGPDCTRYQSFG
jgi:hypothetical protein